MQKYFFFLMKYFETGIKKQKSVTQYDAKN